MQTGRLLLICSFTMFAAPALAEQWEEVSSVNNSRNEKFYFDKDITVVGKNSVRTQYMIVESKPQQLTANGKTVRYDKTVFRADINCTNFRWAFLTRTYYLSGVVQFHQDMKGGDATNNAPTKGTAPFTIGEKACALR